MNCYQQNSIFGPLYNEPVTANALATFGHSVDVTTEPPSEGQVLEAISSTKAEWTDLPDSSIDLGAGAGIVLTPNPITNSGSIAIATQGGLTPGTYTNLTGTVNSQGILTAVSSGSLIPGSVASIAQDSSNTVILTPNPITTTGVIGLTPVSGVSGSYTNADITVNGFGIITAAANGTAPVTSVHAGTGITVSGSTTPTVGITPIITAATVTNPSSLTFNAEGQVTAATSGSTPITTITAGTNINIAGTTISTVASPTFTTTTSPTVVTTLITNTDPSSSLQITDASGGEGGVGLTSESNMTFSSMDAGFFFDNTINQSAGNLALNSSCLVSPPVGVEFTPGSSNPGNSETLWVQTSNDHLMYGSTDLSAGVSGAVNAVTGTSPIVSSGGSSPAISLATSGVTSGSYTNSSITVNSQGLITSASNGTTAVTAVTGTGNISSTGGATPAISISNSPSFSGTVTATTTQCTSGLIVGSGGTLNVLTGNVYAPALTNETNMSAVSNFTPTWHAVGINVVVAGNFSFQASGGTGAQVCSLTFSLPVVPASNWSSLTGVGGSVSAVSASGIATTNLFAGGLVQAFTGSKLGQIQVNLINGTVNQVWTVGFSCTYQS